MEFSLERNEAQLRTYNKETLRIVYDFTKIIQKELGTVLRAAVLFGSASKPTEDNPHDIDMLIVVDDIQIQFNNEMQTAYHIITENAIKATSTRLHITTLRFSNFWEYVRTSDPVLVTVLRDGVPIIDTGFFAPLQLLLQQGRIRPTPESIWSYYAQAPQLLIASKSKVLYGIIDLYWAVINSAHAALMSAGVLPQSPEHVANMLRTHFVHKGLLEEKYAVLCEKLFEMQKGIYNRKIESLSGARHDALFDEANAFVTKMRTFLE